MNAKIQKSDRLLTRSPRNPLITAADIPLPGGAACVFNSGATLHEGEIVMLVNLWDREWMPRFLVGRSRDGVHFEIDPRNRVEPPKEYPYVPHEGIFDTRITTLDGWHYITYNVGSRLGGRIMLARTRDFGMIETLRTMWPEDAPWPFDNDVMRKKLTALVQEFIRPPGKKSGERRAP